MEEQLPDRQAVRPRDAGVRHGIEVDQSETGYFGQAIAAAHEIFERFVHRGHRSPLTECGDRRHADVLVLARVCREHEQLPGGDRGTHQAERLGEAGTCAGIAGAEQRGLEADGEGLGRRRGPFLERALSEHAGEATADDLADQAAHRVDPRQHRSECPRGVLADRGALIREQRGQHPRRLLVEDLGERVHGGDRGDFVIAVQRGGQHPQRAHARIAAGFEREVVGEANGLHDAGGIAHRIQSGLNAHIPSCPRPPGTGRRLIVAR